MNVTARAAVLLWAARIVSMAAGFVAVKAFTSCLSQEVFADQNLIVTGVSLLVAVGLGPLVNAASRHFYEYRNRGQLRRLFTAVGGYYALLTAAGGLIAGGVVSFAYSGRAATVLALSAALLLAAMGAGRLTLVLLNTAGNRLAYSGYTMLTAVLGIVVPLAAVQLAGPSLPAMVGGLALGHTVVGLLALRQTWNLIPSGSVSAGPDCSAVSVRRELVRYSSPFFLSYLFGWTLAWVDRYIIRALRDPSEVATYVVAYQLSSVPLLMLSDVFNQTIQPVLYERAASRPDAGKDFGEWVGRFALVSAALAFLCWALMPTLVRLLAGPKYAHACDVAPWIVFGHLLYAVAIVIENAFYIAKRTDLLPPVTGLAAALNIAGNVLLVPRYGIMAAGAMTAARYGFLLICYIWLSRRVLRWSIPWLDLARGGFLRLSSGTPAPTCGPPRQPAGCSSSTGTGA